MSTAKSRLADLLVEMNLVEDEVMQSVLAEHRRSGRRLARILEERHLIDEERLTRVIAAHLGIEAVSVAGVRVHEKVLELVPTPLAMAHGVLPIAVKRTNQADVVYLVMADPLDVAAIGEVQRVTGRQVRVLIAKASDVDQAIHLHYGNRPRASTSGPALVEDPSAGTPRRRAVSAVQPAPGDRTSGNGRAAANTPRATASPPRGGAVTATRSGAAPRPAGTGSRSYAGRLQVNPRAVLEAGSAVAEPPPLSSAPPTPAPAPLPPDVDDLRGEGALAQVAAPFPDPSESGSLRSQPSITFADMDPSASGRGPGALGEWSRSVREWEGPPPTDDHTESGKALTFDEADSALADALGAPSAAAEPRPEEGDADPVTALAPLGPPVGVDWSSEIGSYEPTVGTPDAEADRSPSPSDAMMEQTAPPASPPQNLLAAALEIPVPWTEDAHPFEGPGPSDVPVGLERTAIIPSAELFGSEFVPPPLDKPVGVATGLVGSDDIPTSMAAVEARSAQDAGDASEIEEETLEPIGDEDVVSLDSETATVRPSPGSDSARIPVIEPSQLVSLIDDPYQEDTGTDDMPFGGRSAAADLEVDPPLSDRPPIRPGPDDGLTDGLIPAPPRRGPAATPVGKPPSNRPSPAGADVLALSADAGLSAPVVDTHRPTAADPSRPALNADATRPSQADAEPHRLPLAEAGSLTSVTEAPETGNLAPPVTTPANEPLAFTRAPTASARAVTAIDDALRSDSGPGLTSSRSTEATRHATALLAGLRSGDSLSSAQRAELLLALGRLFLDKGIITETELLKALLE